MERSSELNCLWRLADPGATVSREWDGDAVVFDERTGATHLLGAGATGLFRAIAQASSPLPTDALIVAAFPEQTDDVAYRERIEAAILQLERSGLIERLRP